MRLIVRNIAVEKEDIPVYKYGLFMIFQSILTTTCILLLGVLWKKAIETIIMLFVFCTSQTMGGGYHAKTHLTCFLTMLVGAVCCLMTYLLSIPVIFLAGIGSISLGVLLAVPIVIHKNKSYLFSYKKELTHKSQLATYGLACGFLLCLLINHHSYIHAYTVALFCSAVSRLLAFPHGERA